MTHLDDRGNDVKFLGGDGGDRFRSAGNRFKLWEDWEIGLLMFTGDPGLRSEDRAVDETAGPNGTYISGTSDKYRLGALYLGYKGYRVGVNSEGVRNYVQNKVVHRYLTGKPGSPYFKDLKLPLGLYYGHYSTNPYTTW